MIVWAPYPIPVIVKDENFNEKDAYVIYVESSAQWDNDIWTCVLCDTGIVRHFTTNQIKIYKNLTFGIK